MKVCILIVVGGCLSLAADVPKEKAEKADLDKLQGGWQLVSAERPMRSGFLAWQSRTKS